MKKTHASAPINIALIKYWGKQDSTHVIPFNGSLSLSLEELRTHTYLSSSSEGFIFSLNHQLQSEQEHLKMRTFLSHFTSSESINHLKIESFNDVPTAAGLASSASGFAALARAAKHYYAIDMDDDRLNYITRLGSGSACRSLYSGAVVWQKDGHVYTLKENLDAYKMMVLILSSAQKSISSREAMRVTVETSPYYPAWIKQAELDLTRMKQAIIKDDFALMGRTMEASFLAMHASMMAAYPPIHYVSDQSWAVIDFIQKLRQQTDLRAYCTMDAGSNVKILYRTHDEKDLMHALRQHFTYDILTSRIGKGAYIHEDTDA